MNVSIIVIGDEILLGQVTDTNSGYLARTIAPAGWSVADVAVVADDAQAIRSAIERAMSSSPIVLTTGGLGPTKDDITKATLRDIFGGEMKLDPDVAANVERVMAARGRTLNDLTRAQAIVPSSATIIQNAVGTAPIMWFEKDGHTLVAMPGVPFETEQMFASEVFPRLLSRHGGDVAITHRYIQVWGMSESAIAETLAPIEAALPAELHLAYLPSQGIVRLRLDGVSADAAELEKMATSAADSIAGRLGDAVLCRDDRPVAALLLDELRARSLRCTSAESCTGGNIAHRLTMIAGSSDAFNGSVVAYSNDVKERLLGVAHSTLEKHGAVSIPVVEQMAAGACRATCAQLGMATSGIAGPGGATPGKPVGTVCIAVAIDVGGGAFRSSSHTYHFAGNRARVIDHATTTALVEAVRFLRANVPEP